MRESRLLLLKNITPQPVRKQNANLLSSLVEYNTKPNNKKVNIPASNISTSPSKHRKQQAVFICIIKGEIAGWQLIDEPVQERGGGEEDRFREDVHCWGVAVLYFEAGNFCCYMVEGKDEVRDDRVLQVLQRKCALINYWNIKRCDHPQAGVPHVSVLLKNWVLHFLDSGDRCLVIAIG